MKITASATRKSDGWYPVLSYENGGRVIGDVWSPSMESATSEAASMIKIMEEYPESFTKNHPTENQLIDLTLT